MKAASTLGVLFLIVTVVAATSCRRNYRYYQVMPPQGQQDLAAPSCSQQCQGAPNYLACFARCPGVVRKAGFCKQMRLANPNDCIERREFSLGKTLLVFGVLGLIVLGGVAAANAASGDGDEF